MNETTVFFDLYTAKAEIFLGLSSLVMLVLGTLIKDVRSFFKLAIIGVIILTLTMVLIVQSAGLVETIYSFNGMLVYDRYGAYAKILVLIGAVASIFIAVRDIAHTPYGRYEYIILILLAVLGMFIMISSNDMLTLYMGLELQSLALYILAAFNRNSLHSSEAGLKYFILGALSSGMLLFGISLVYGYTGTTSYDVINHVVMTDTTTFRPMPMIVGMVFVLVGIAFKISAVPFHMWTPDVYQGAPSCVTGFLATAPKMAAIALLGRLLFTAFETSQGEWVQVLYALSMASMIVGALGGLAQSNLYRLLAYSSIGHMGFALMGFIAGGADGVTSTLIYMAIYLVMTVGTFAMIVCVRGTDGMAAKNLNDFAGLSDKSKLLAYGLALMMFSMAGIPPLAGFFGKFVVFMSAVNSGYMVLAVVGVLSSVVSAFYYLRLIKIMFFDKVSVDGGCQYEKSYILRWVSIPALAFTVAYIIFPDWLAYHAFEAASSL